MDSKSPFQEGVSDDITKHHNHCMVEQWLALLLHTSGTDV